MRLNVPFDLDSTLCCGQVFRWKKIGDWWFGVVGDHVVKLHQCNAELLIKGATEDFMRQYLGLNDNLEHINRCVNKDPFVAAALKQFQGLRLVHQLPWECLVSYICATNKNIPAIEMMLRKISAKYGEKKFLEDKQFYTLPSAKSLACSTENGLRECGLGYRAKYLLATAKKIDDEKIDLETLKRAPYLQAKKVLLSFLGVGAKVADCVLLFSLEKMEAFPVDLWVKRVILNYYSEKFPPEMVKKMQSRKSVTPKEYEAIGDFARSYFGCYAGYAQEYLFHMERTQR
jgi:N-glycosylase/DNA lyase